MAENEKQQGESGWLAWFRGAYEALITVVVGLAFFVAFAYAKGVF
ncbi:hypothetical protein [Actinomadura rudentiformis]|nr:hypothetical protein [Actinomadura rudentiformis]